MRFHNRSHAGRCLAEKLHHYQGRADVLVLGLPRGGVVVANEVAEALDVPMDVFVVRKIGVPGYEELALGAIASGDILVVNDDVARHYGGRDEAMADPEVKRVLTSERRELKRREKAYRGDRPALDVKGKCVLLVDDGLATGATMRAAIHAVKKLSPTEIVVAVPVAPPSTCRELRPEVDALICVDTPLLFAGVGQWYEDFTQTEDSEVVALLENSPHRCSS